MAWEMVESVHGIFFWGSIRGYSFKSVAIVRDSMTSLSRSDIGQQRYW